MFMTKLKQAATYLKCVEKFLLVLCATFIVFKMSLLLNRGYI